MPITELYLHAVASSTVLRLNIVFLLNRAHFKVRVEDVVGTMTFARSLSAHYPIRPIVALTPA